MKKIPIEDIVSKVDEIDSLIKDSGWNHDTRIYFSLDNNAHRIEIYIYDKHEEEYND